MWKKNDSTTVSPPRQSANAKPPAHQPTPPAKAPEAATIGPTVTVKGEIRGDEDLLIEGSVEGKVVIQRHRVTVGERGHVAADIEAAHIRVAGEVRGNLTGTDQVVLQSTGQVEGDITAGNVTLENGARFKGSIDMETKPKKLPADKGQRDADADANAHTQPHAQAGTGASASLPSKPNGPSATGTSATYGSRA